jgi:hypothetical protein
VSNQFDFWLGEWECSWEGGLGSNVVTAELDGAVILERFDGRPGTELRGLSVSVYDADADRWRQTWVDSQGGYIDLAGRFDGDAMVLVHERRDGDAPVRYRMRFTEIGPDSLVWLWERFERAGGGWLEQWRIDYARRGGRTAPPSLLPSARPTSSS